MHTCIHNLRGLNTIYFVSIMCVVQVFRGKSQDQVSGVCSCIHTTHTHTRARINAGYTYDAV